MKNLFYTDRILETPAGAFLMACEPVQAVNLREGGLLHYPVGTRFRVIVRSGDTLMCHDGDANTVSFQRKDCLHLDAVPAPKTHKA